MVLLFVKLNELFEMLHCSWKADIPENIRLRFSIAKKSRDSKEKPKKGPKKKKVQNFFRKGSC